MQATDTINHGSNLQRNIQAELVNLLYTQARPAIIGSLIVASCLVYGLHQVVPANLLYGWYALMICVTISRYVAVKLYFQHKPLPAASDVWRNIFIAMVAVAGVSWSLVGTLLMPASSVHQTFIASSLAGVAAGAIPFFSGSRTACFAFVLPVLLPFSLWSLLQFDKPHEILCLLILLYMVLLLISCFRTHKAIYSAVKLKFENDHLVANLTVAQNELKVMNRELKTEIVDRQHAENLLRESEEQYRLVTDALPVLISYLDMNLKYKFVNRAHAEWFKRPLGEIADKPIQSILNSTEFSIFHENAAKLILSDKVSYETVMNFDNHEERYVSVTLIPHKKSGELHGFFSLISDMTPRINYLATHDALTDLPNRSLFNAKFIQSLNRCQIRNMPLAIVFVDLDHFKKINDTLGHDVGDQLLVKVVELIKRSLREIDVLARLGGDEFIILLENVTRDETISILKRIQQTLAFPVDLSGSEVFITTSIGVSMYPDDGSDLQILLKNADLAIYSAKESGRNMFKFYMPEMNQVMMRKTSLENDLRVALDQTDQLEVYYQPVMDIASNAITSVEALIRWHHPEQGPISPSEFVPLAEQSGLILAIGEWVLRQACKQSYIWQHEHKLPRHLRTAINLSARQFKEANLKQLIMTVLKETGLSGNQLTLELTESLIMHDIDYSTEVIKSLKELGIVISMDDFGTGYSSLSYLRRFPIDILKIDRSFVSDIDKPSQHGEDSAAIVKAIVAMAHSLKMKVIAEGVETMAQYQFLKEHGCDEIQGFLLSRPVPPVKIATFLQDSFSVETYLQQQAARNNLPLY